MGYTYGYPRYPNINNPWHIQSNGAMPKESEVCFSRNNNYLYEIFFGFSRNFTVSAEIKFLFFWHCSIILNRLRIWYPSLGIGISWPCSHTWSCAIHGWPNIHTWPCAIHGWLCSHTWPCTIHGLPHIHALPCTIYIAYILDHVQFTVDRGYMPDHVIFTVDRMYMPDYVIFTIDCVWYSAI